jgi:hypothetical protein
MDILFYCILVVH